MELTTTEKKVIEHMRKGAVIRMIYHDDYDLETAKTIIHEYCGRQPEPQTRNCVNWISSWECDEELPELTVFF